MVMVLYVEQPAGQHTIHFFTSPNLREWTLASVTEAIRPGNRSCSSARTSSNCLWTHARTRSGC